MSEYLCEILGFKKGVEKGNSLNNRKPEKLNECVEGLWIEKQSIHYQSRSLIIKTNKCIISKDTLRSLTNSVSQPTPCRQNLHFYRNPTESKRIVTESSGKKNPGLRTIKMNSLEKGASYKWKATLKIWSWFSLGFVHLLDCGLSATGLPESDFSARRGHLKPFGLKNRLSPLKNWTITVRWPASCLLLIINGPVLDKREHSHSRRSPKIHKGANRTGLILERTLPLLKSKVQIGNPAHSDDHVLRNLDCFINDVACVKSTHLWIRWNDSHLKDPVRKLNILTADKFEKISFWRPSPLTPNHTKGSDEKTVQKTVLGLTNFSGECLLGAL